MSQPFKRYPPGECPHTHLVPYEQVAGCRRWHKDRSIIDWTSNIINAHYIRTTKYLCVYCGTIITPPSDASDNFNRRQEDQLAQPKNNKGDK